MFTCLFPRQQEKELGVTTPAVWDTAGISRWAKFEEREGTGSPVNSPPFPITSEKQGASDNARQAQTAPSFIYSLIRSIHIDMPSICKVLVSEKGAGHSSSLQGAPNLVGETQENPQS